MVASCIENSPAFFPYLLERVELAQKTKSNGAYAINS
jgi:hypothetical protein